MADDLQDLFDSPLDSPAGSSPPPAGPAPAPPSMPSASVEGLAQEIGQLKHYIQTVLPTLLRSQAAPMALPPSGPPPPSNALEYKDQEFLDEAAANALLSSPNVRGELNTMLNKTARQVHTHLAGEIARDRTEFNQFREQSRQAEQRRQVSQQMQNDFSAFYGEHPDLEPHTELVMLEAQNMAREYNQNPYLFTGFTRDGIMKSLAERTQRRVAAIVATASGQPGTPSSRLPARRTTVERGSGTRIGVPSQPKNANEKELEDMDRFVRG